MSATAKVDFEMELPADLAKLHLPEGLDRRLNHPLAVAIRREEMLRERWP